MNPTATDTPIDLLVIGSGAGGLSAAVTAAHQGLKVLVLEKEKLFGGTTAWSGGWMWIPRNPLARAAGIEEDLSKPLSYLRHELGGQFDEAVKAANQADVVIVAVGERGWMTGEASSRADIGLPGVQEDLIKALVKTGKPIVVVLMNGRPLTFPWVAENATAILETWFAGTQGGNAIADVLFGDYNPAGKLTMTFPRSVGQVPIYYNAKHTGRPFDANNKYSSKYMDAPNTPQYPFGFGLSYTTFEYSNLAVNKNTFGFNEKLEVSITVKNTGNYDGEEVVQLYVRDLVGSITRPVKELKGFKKIMIKKGESKTVNFTLTSADLAFYHPNLEKKAETGDFDIMIGGNSDDVKMVRVSLK